MPLAEAKIRILLIRSWLHNIEPLRVALRASGLEPWFIRVDIEPALHAALSRGGFDVVVLDPETPTLSRETATACLRDHGIKVPIVVLESIDAIGSHVRAALVARHS